MKTNYSIIESYCIDTYFYTIIASFGVNKIEMFTHHNKDLVDKVFLLLCEYEDNKED